MPSNMKTSRHALKSHFLSILKQTLHLGDKGQIFCYFLLFISINLSMSCQAQTFHYFDVDTLKYTAILTPRNYNLIPFRPANDYNLYGIKNQTGLTNEYKKRLQAVFPNPDTALIQLLDSIAYKSVFRKNLRIYYCHYRVPIKALVRIQEIEDKLFQFFQETQTINLGDYIRIDSVRFEESNYSFAKLGLLFK